MGFEQIIPQMTSNNTPSPFVASSSNQLASYAAFNAFNSSSGAWISDVANSSIQIDLGRPYEIERVLIDSVNTWTSARLLSFTLQASHDALHWVNIEMSDTKDYRFDKEKNYGVFRYVRLINRLTTSRGGVVSRLQLYQDDKGGLIDVEANDIWIRENAPTIISGTIYPSKDIKYAIFVNEEQVTEWAAISEETKINKEIGGSLFKEGANVIEVVIESQDGIKKSKEVVLYKINWNTIAYGGSKFPMAIKNSPKLPREDKYIGQVFPVLYLNSESGLGYMFKYNPSSEFHARIEDNVIRAERSNRKEALLIKKMDNASTDSIREGSSIKNEVMSSIHSIRNGIKEDGYKSAIKTAKAVMDIFYQWGVFDRKREGIKQDGFMAKKKELIGIDVLRNTSLNARRIEDIKNALTMINAYVHGIKREGLGIVEYSKLFKEVYPEKDSIIAMGLISGSLKEKTGILMNGYSIADFIHKGGIVPVKYNAEIDVLMEGIKGDMKIGTIDKILLGVESSCLLGEGFENEGIKLEKTILLTSNDSDSIIRNDDKVIDSIVFKEVKGVTTSYTEKVGEKEFAIDDTSFAQSLPSLSLVVEEQSFFDSMAVEAMVINNELDVVNVLEKEFNYDERPVKGVDKTEKEVNETDERNVKVTKVKREAWDEKKRNTLISLMPKDFDFKNVMSYVDDMGVDADMIQGVSRTEKISKEVWEKEYVMQVDSVSMDAWVDIAESKIEKISKIVMEIHEQLYMDKIAKEIMIVELMKNIDSVEKASIILQNWNFFKKISKQAVEIDDSMKLFIKDKKRADIEIGEIAIKELMNGFILDRLLLDYEMLDSYISQLTNSFQRIDDFNAIEMRYVLKDKEKSLGLIEESITSYRENVEKNAIVHENPVLGQDLSNWQDIYDRYSPGVDILDPPDADYDYSQLKPSLYEENTGRPIGAIGPTNQAKVVVRTPLNHPIPENKDVGVDDSKRIAVDNYIFIDVLLALESIKTRNKIKYAGTPAGRTIQEVFSQLYTWIQQAAPGHEEYERMFRFARWYAEAIVIKESKFILDRIYNPWQSTLHKGHGLGTIHTKEGFVYNTARNTLDSVGGNAALSFSMESMVDGQFMIRGYFDNPTTQGTMEISVDGKVVDITSTNGIISRTIEIPQGVHSYNIVFSGEASELSISTIEVTGVVFISAETIIDDKDTNGLKSLTLLISQLLGYFDLHHGGGKVKGTMEVRQRAVWNTI